MGYASRSIVAAVAAGLLSLPAGGATIVSDFSAGTQGWQVGNVAGTTGFAVTGAATYNGSGGVPGGYISTADTATEVAFIAPAAFTGNLQAFYGGTISYDIVAQLGTDSGTLASVILYSGTTSISYGLPGPATNFTHVAIPILESGWRYYQGNGYVTNMPVAQAAFLSILGNVSGFTIHADYRTGDDLTGLDNVTLLSVGGVPEPAGWMAMLTGFALIGSAMRRRRARSAAA